MTMFHIGREGEWSRCVASVRSGGGVSDCPVGSGRGGHLNSVSLAGSGGGTVRRSERSSVVGAIDEETGLFEVVSEGGDRVHFYDGESGELISWRDRRSVVQRERFARRAAVSGPSLDLVEVNNETPGQLRAWFGEFERVHGVEITEYNEDLVKDTLVFAHDNSVHIPKYNNAVRDRQNYTVFMKRAVLNAVVFEMGSEESVNSILRNNFWGPFKKVYNSGR